MSSASLQHEIEFEELFEQTDLPHEDSTDENDKKPLVSIGLSYAEYKEQTVVPSVHREVIKIIGVGGAGNNAINHIMRSGVGGVQFVAVNTDVRSLEQCAAASQLVLGAKLTKGLGAGAMPDVGKEAALESLDEIRTMLQGADMVYLAAGMGGGTGTGAAPVIASLARELGILSVAVVTRPFRFEGPRRNRHAEEGIKTLSGCVDALITISNDKLLNMTPENFPLQEAFKMVDDVLLWSVQGVTNLIVSPGLVNVDFADLRTVMKNAGHAVMGIGVAYGEERAKLAVQRAIESPLMDTPLDKAKGILLNVTAGPDLSLHEVTDAAKLLGEKLDPEGTFVWGFSQREDYQGKVEMIVVGTGFGSVGALPIQTAQAAPSLQNLQNTPIIQNPARPKLKSERQVITRDGVSQERTEIGLFAQTPANAYDTPSVWRRK